MLTFAKTLKEGIKRRRNKIYTDAEYAEIV